MEEGSGLTPDMYHTRPANVLVQNWVGGKPAAFDFTVTSPLIPKTLGQSSIRSGFAAELAETRKHQSNNAKCSELGWSCLPLAVETYGNWGKKGSQYICATGPPNSHAFRVCEEQGHP